MRERAMLIGTRVRRAIRRPARLERRKVGLAAHLARSVHFRLGRLVGNSLPPEARRFGTTARLGRLFETLGRSSTDFVIRWFNRPPVAPSGGMDFPVAVCAPGTFNGRGR